MLQVKVLGHTEVRGRWGPLKPRGTKQRILLVHLVLARGESVPMSLLVEALWGQSPPRDPEHAIQAHVSRLRGVLPIDVERTVNGYRIAAQDIDLDVDTFERIVRQARDQMNSADLAEMGAAAHLFDEALELWRGPAFADLDDVSTLEPTAARLNEDWHRAQGDRIDARLRAGDEGDLVAPLEQLVVEHPYRERYWSQLMRVLHGQGRTGEALQVYERARQLLVNHLGSEPGPLLADTHLMVLAEPVTSPAAAAELRGTPLAGRLHELKVLAELWRDVPTSLRVATISGDPGIGKTRLAREFAAQLAATGVQVLRGHCDATTPVPYQPIREALPDDVAGAEGDELFRRLVAVTNASPALLIIDDLQWADRQTLLLLRQIIRDPRAIQVMLVLTVRDREHLRGTANYDLLTQFMRQSDRVRHLPLSGLDPDDVVALLRGEWGERVDQDSDAASRVVAASGGNPLFVLELARDPDGQEATTVGVRELIAGRLAGFTDRLRELLAHAAAMGSQFDPLIVRQACGLAPHEFDEQLDAAIFARLIEPVVGSREGYAFTHELVRSAVYEEISPLHRRQIHQRIAEAIEGLHASDLNRHHGELAHHHAAASTPGSAQKAVHYLTLAGAAAVSQRALAVGVQHYRRALELLAHDADWTQRCDLLTQLGSAESLAGDPAYRSHLLDAARLATDHGDVRRLTEAVVANSRGWWSSTAGIDHERVIFIEAALAHVHADDRGTRAQLLSAWAVENARDPGLRRDILARSAEAVLLAEELADDRILAAVLGDKFAVSYALFEDPHRCIEVADRIVALARRKADPTIRLIGLIALAQASMTAADFVASDRALAESLELADTLDLPPRLWLAKGWQAMCVATRGDLDQAETLAVEVLELGLGWDQPDAMTWFAGQLFAIRWMQGRLPELIDAIENEVTTQAGGIPAWRAAYALALAQAGRDEAAGQILDEFVDRDFAQLPVDMLWLHALVFLSETAAALGREDVALAVYQRLEPHAGLMAHNGTIDAGPVDLALARTAMVLGSAQADKHLRAAEELCQRIDAPLWLARVRELSLR